MGRSLTPAAPLALASSTGGTGRSPGRVVLRPHHPQPPSTAWGRRPATLYAPRVQPDGEVSERRGGGGPAPPFVLFFWVGGAPLALPGVAAPAALLGPQGGGGLSDRGAGGPPRP